MPIMELFIKVPAELEGLFRAGTHSIEADIKPDEVDAYRHLFNGLMSDAIDRTEILKAAAVEMASLGPPLAMAE